jgi:hypothetical protein
LGFCGGSLNGPGFIHSASDSRTTLSASRHYTGQSSKVESRILEACRQQPGEETLGIHIGEFDTAAGKKPVFSGDSEIR